MSQQLPLTGIRILDLSTVIFGPYATHLLADLGAEVIKLEPQGGDAVRNTGHSAKTPRMMGPLFMRMNRGKKSVVFDLKTPAGKDALAKLVASSQVLVHNIRPDAVERAGLGYEAMKALRPDLIYVHCTGYDTRGPYGGRPAYDDIIQAASGLTTLMPRVDGNLRPRFVPMAVADKVSGLHGAYAVLAAIIHRLRTGQGQRVEVPMFETMVNFTLLEHLYEATFKPAIGDWGYSRQLDPIRQPMATSDGYIAVAPYADPKWIAFFTAIGRPDVLAEPGLDDLMARRANVDRLYTYMAEALATRTTAEWLDFLGELEIPASDVNSVPDLLENEHLAAVGLFRERQHPSEGTYLEVRSPIHFGAFDPPDLSHPPLLGQDTEEVARELGVKL